MIQRIQSIFISFSASLSFIAAGFECSSAQTLSIFGINLKSELFFVSVFSGLASLVSLFLFKNRKLQINLNRVVILLNTILVALFLYYLLTVSGGLLDLKKGILAVLFLLVVVLLVFANQYITKDERLVKSVNRIR